MTPLRSGLLALLPLAALLSLGAGDLRADCDKLLHLPADNPVYPSIRRICGDMAASALTGKRGYDFIRFGKRHADGDDGEEGHKRGYDFVRFGKKRGYDFVRFGKRHADAPGEEGHKRAYDFIRFG